jgi:type I restriction enzyme S subunit
VSFDELKLSEADIEIIDGDRGVNYPKQNEFYDIGYCLFLNAKNVTKDGFDFNEKSFISREKDNLLRKGKLVRNDIVLTTRGTVGNVAFYNNRVPFNNILINSGMVILRAKQSEYLPEFVYWMFRSNYIQDQINALKTGSAQPQLPITIMRTIKVLKPKLCEQKVIAATLSALDDMIELNNQINKTLEEMAIAIFKSWFVDFEPFKDGEFEESELGLIPKGWRVVELGEITEEIRERVKDRKIPVFSAVKTGDLVLSEDYFTKQVFSRDISKYIVVKPFDFAYNPARINIGSIGINEFSYTGCVSPVYVVFRTDQKYKWFFKMLTRTERFKKEVNTRASGSVRQTLNFDEFSKIKVYIHMLKSLKSIIIFLKA